jgi:hypothetical protein
VPCQLQQHDLSADLLILEYLMHAATKCIPTTHVADVLIVVFFPALLVQLTINDDGGACGRGSSALTFTAQPGVDYWIIVSAYSKLIVSMNINYVAT